MQEQIICNKEDLVAIADAVRASNGSTETYNVPELSVAAVEAIGSGSAGIDDTTPSTNTTYSSSKINALLKEQKEAIDAKVSTDQLNTAVDNALIEAKNSGEFKGDKGDKGEAPVKGVDYWTEEDKEEIIDVLHYPVTPQMFGAVGDGEADDTNALQAAFNEVAVNGGYLYIPKGRYKVTSPITVDWGRDSDTRRNFLQKIVGAGSQAFEKYYDNSVIVGYNIPAYRGVIELVGSGNTWGTQTRIEDLAIECDKSSCDPMSFALMYGDARNFRMHRVKLRGHNGIYARCGSIVDENGASATTTYEQINVKFEQCDIFTFEDNVKGFAFLPEGVITDHYATMDNIVVDSCLISGVWVINSVNIMFQSCHILIRNVANKLITTDNVGVLNGYEIDYATGYYVAQAMSAVFQNCYFEDYRRGIHITPTLGNVRNVSIMNCYLNPGCNQFNADGSRLCSDYGIRISPGMSGKVVRNVLVQNNVFRFIEGDTEYVIANVSNEFANHFVFKDNCTTYTQDVPKVVNTTTSGYDIQNGLDSGASVKSMNTSADGKELTITLTNGKSVTFNTGASAPVKGVDYFTAAEIEDIKDDVTVHTDAYIASELAKRGQLKPEFAQNEDWLNANGDTSKLYVLPDGYIYAYMKKESVGEGNLTPNFTNLMNDSEAYISEGKRYSLSSSAWKNETGVDSLVFPFNYSSGTNIIRIRGVNDTNLYDYIYMGSTNQAFSTSIDTGTLTIEENGDLVYTITMSSSGNNYLTIPVASISDTSKVIVTLNEEIEYVSATGKWSENLVPKSIDTDGSIFNGTGYKDHYRMSSSGEVTSQNSATVFGFMPAKKGDKFQITGVRFGRGAQAGVYGYVSIFDANKTKLQSASVDTFNGNQSAYGFTISPLKTSGYVYPTDVITVDFSKAPDNMAYVRFSASIGMVETFPVGTGANAVVTKWVEGGTTVTEGWFSTGHAFVPADYESRIIELETGLDNAKNDIGILSAKVDGMQISKGATTAFSTPAYAPVPQQPADGTYDFHGLNITTEQAHTYMNDLAAKHKGYVTKQIMGKDQSGTYDHNRYVLCKSYWRAWLKPNYPMMFAWKNGSVIIYSVSCSPRVGDTMYSTPYIGTVYNTVTAVNASAANPSTGTPGTPSTRTVNGLVFDRYKAGDIEPTVVYTRVATSLSDLNGGTVYDSTLSSLTKVTTYTKEAITCADGITYTRYPFEDLKADKTKPLSVFILANEHGHRGDNKVPSITLMRMAKDLCENRENPFLQWLKENAMITMIPVGNPWGYDPSAGDNGAGYYNSRGININRNYDTPGWAGSDNNYGDDTTFGAYPGSEVETQHIMNTMHLCKAKVGLSMHGMGLGQYKTQATEYTEGLMWQGCGYDKTRMAKVAEVLFSDYGCVIGGHTSLDQSYEYCGKSPAYIQYIGAVGGLNETPDYETGTLDLYTPTVMEASYTQMLLFLQTWCEEALTKK